MSSGVRISAFVISGAGWYDAAYENSDNPKSGTLPSTGGLAYDYSWAGLTYAPGDYSHEAEHLSYAGGELLDAFVFGNWYIGETALGVRAGRHTIFWGQSLLATGAITGIAGSMTALDSEQGPVGARHRSAGTVHAVLQDLVGAPADR